MRDRIEAMDKNIKIEKYRNGMSCIVINMPHLNSVAVDVFVKMGSLYETGKEGGMAHFLEHMAFKGTKKRKSSYEINKEIDSRGGQISASTSFEFTNYRIRAVPENLKWAIELLSDMVINSVIPDKEVLKEKGVVIEEIKMYDDNPTMGASFDFIELMYKDSVKGCWSISGKEEDVSSFNHKVLMSYRKNYLIDENVIVVLTGNVEASGYSINKLIAYVKNSFKKLSSGKKRKYEWGKDFVLGTETEKKIKKKLSQGHFCLGFPSVGRISEDRYAFKLIDIVLAGNMSSKLFFKLREELGWAYYIFSESNMFSDFGFSGIQAGVSLNKMEKAIDKVTDEFCNLYKTITDEEIVDAKRYWLAKNKLNLDSLKFWSNFIGQSYLLDGRLLSLDEEVEAVRNVKNDEIRRVAKQYFDPKMRRLLTIS